MCAAFEGGKADFGERGEARYFATLAQGTGLTEEGRLITNFTFLLSWPSGLAQPWFCDVFSGF
jgi:hypothetical protein